MPGEGAPYFEWETVQLTEAVLANLTEHELTDVEFFAFEDTAEDRRRSGGPGSGGPRCKVMPGDAEWPSPMTWTVANLLTGGALIPTTPLAAPCYAGPHYNTTKCDEITARWSDPRLHVSDPASNHFPIFQGLTCLPPSLRDTGTCELGGYAAYSVRIQNVAQIQLAINFARNRNLRLVVKNTGHDFGDKSIGAGALSIWTHGLKDLQFFESYTFGSYSGPAFKLGAGVATEEVYLAAEQNNVTVVGGECRVCVPFHRPVLPGL